MPACLEVLINAGASLHDEDRYGISAAKHIAALSVDGTYEKKLREQLACRLPLDEMIEDLDLSPITEVILGIRAGDVKSLLSKLSEWDLDINELDRVGRSPLDWAARQGDCYAVEQLISHGADPNIANITKTTPLMEVAASSTSTSEAKVQCAKLLMAAGAELKKEDIFGQTAFYIACYGVNTTALVELMLIHEKWDLYAENWDGELAYSQVQDSSVIKYLMTKGLDIDHRNHFGRPSLMAAVFAQRTQSCKILLELGADVKLVDDDGMTILHVAAKGADAATMKLLTDWKMEGVDPDALDTVPPPYKAKKYFARRKWTAKSEVTAFSRLSWSVRRGYKSGQAKRAEEVTKAEEGGNAI